MPASKSSKYHYHKKRHKKQIKQIKRWNEFPDKPKN